jgi:hypothetical protein
MNENDYDGIIFIDAALLKSRVFPWLNDVDVAHYSVPSQGPFNFFKNILPILSKRYKIYIFRKNSFLGSEWDPFFQLLQAEIAKCVGPVELWSNVTYLVLKDRIKKVLLEELKNGKGRRPYVIVDSCHNDHIRNIIMADRQSGALNAGMLVDPYVSFKEKDINFLKFFGDIDPSNWEDFIESNSKFFSTAKTSGV